MVKVNCLNPISKVGTSKFTDNYEFTDNFEEANAVLVRSAAMHDMELSDNLLAVARAGAGVNNIPLDKCAEKGVVVFNTPGANANGVKELLLVETNGLKTIRKTKTSTRQWKKLKRILPAMKLWAKSLELSDLVQLEV